MKIAAVVVAAGRGERLGRAVPKAFVSLLGQTLLERSLRVMAGMSEVTHVQPVVAAEALERFEALGLDAIPKVAPPVVGGAERQDSVAAGIAALPDDVDLVAVHDAARCLVTPGEIREVIAMAARTGAALLAIPARDTIKRVRGGLVVETPDRSECWAAQTPQVFRVALLRAALENAREQGVKGTDDAQLVERLGEPVTIVEGSPENMKITLPADLVAAENLLLLRGETAGAPSRQEVGGRG